MSGAFLITLDTTAPHLTWGAVTGADPGSTLRVAYSLDEPSVESAQLQLSDRTLAMTVGSLTLDVAIPDDAAGNGQVIAHVVDDVGNRATYTLAVSLGGVAPPVQTGFQPSTGGGMPRGPMAPVVVRLAGGGGRALAAPTRIEAGVADTSTAFTRSSYTLPSRELYRRDGGARLRTGPLRVEATVASTSTTRLGGPVDRITRRDGPDYEDELLLLDLL